MINHEAIDAIVTSQGGYGKGVTPKIPIGLCQCGCGGNTSISPRNHKGWKRIKGQPVRFLVGHGRKRPLEERLWEKVKVGRVEECWIWKSTKNNKGYGLIGIDGRMQLAHRVAYELVRGKIPAGQCALHKCDTPLCVNPYHMFIGTHAENMADMANKRRNRRGTIHQWAVITDAKAARIKQMLRDGVKRSEIAKAIGCKIGIIVAIDTGKSWKHVT